MDGRSRCPEETDLNMPRSIAPPCRAVVALVFAIGLVTIAPLPSTHAASVGPVGQAAIAAVTTAEACLDDQELAFLAEINQYRGSNGLAPLTVTQTLTAASEHHSVDMANTSWFDHVMSDGTTVEQNVRAHGYTGSSWGENIAAGTYMSDAATVFEAWRTSPSHNANMLSADFAAIGIARDFNASSAHGWYWTTIFGGTADGAAVSCSGAAVPNPAPPADQEPPPGSAPTPGANATTTTDLNLRGGPGTTFQILAVMPGGSQLTVNGAAEAGFYPVSFGGLTGWAAVDFVATGGPPADLPPPAATPTGSATTTSDLNLRAGPSTGDAILAVMPPGAAVTLMGESTNGFERVTYNGTSGWAFGAYLSDGTATAPAPSPTLTDGATTATTTDLNLRDGPGTGFAVLAVMPAGATVTLTGGSENGFLSVQYGGTAGWAAAEYLGGGLASTPPPASGTAITTTDLNFRAGPSISDAVIAILPPGTSVTPLGQSSNGFIQVDYNGTPGWVSAEYIA